MQLLGRRGKRENESKETSKIEKKEKHLESALYPNRFHNDVDPHHCGSPESTFLPPSDLFFVDLWKVEEEEETEMHPRRQNR